MKFLLSLLVLSLATVSAATGWSDLRVTFPKFSGLPQTATDATKQGWVVDSTKTCTSGSAVGIRMYLPSNDNPLSAFLLFNNQGRISGVQGASVLLPPVSTISPSGPWKQDIVRNTTLYTLTMYFRDPTTICNGADTGAKIGDGLWFAANGINATSIVQKESDLVLGAGTWGKGKCFATMGNHYWFNLSPTAPCDPLLPLFLLYNRGKLNGFGWALPWGPMQPGSRWEHPTANILGLFFANGQQPTCFQDQGRVFSTMHFYLSNPLLDFC